MKKLCYIAYCTLLSICMLDNCQAGELNIIQLQMRDTLREIDKVKFQFYQKSKSLCESIADQHTDNYYNLMHYIPKFLENVYTINIINKKQITSIDELFNLNKLYNNSNYLENKYPDDKKNNELLYNILMSSNRHQAIQDINEIFKTRRQIDNLKEIFEDLETTKIRIISQRRHHNHNNNKEKQEKN